MNVMTASVLRGLVEAALSDLLAFFRIHADVDVHISEGSKNKGNNAATASVSGNRQLLSSPTGFRGGGPDGNHRTPRSPGESNINDAADSFDPEQEAVAGLQRESRRCPPTFKVKRKTERGTLSGSCCRCCHGECPPSICRGSVVERHHFAYSEYVRLPELCEPLRPPSTEEKKDRT